MISFSYLFIIFSLFLILKNQVYLNIFNATIFDKIIFILFFFITIPIFIFFWIFKFFIFVVNFFKILIFKYNNFLLFNNFLLNLHIFKNPSNSFSDSILFILNDYYQFIFLKIPFLFNSFFINIYDNYLNYPLFIWFGIFFCFTSFLSLLTISYLGFYGVFILNLISIIMLWLSVLPYLFSILKNNNYYYISLGKWMYLSTNFKVNFDFFVDNIALSFAFLTISIAVFVYIFAFSYFRYEPLVDRLILLLNTFVISMVFLVTSGNFVMLFLGWEMIGLTSFFLINFWMTRVGTLKAAFKAFSFNKLSDMSLFFAMLLIFSLTYNLDILTFISQIHLYEGFVLNFFFFKVGYLELIALCLMLSAFIKSAQIGAHIWLPDSMEAPVPASALIHSATLVSAGIFLLLRFTVLFELSYISLTLIAIIGSVTAFYGGFVSAYQSDTKRILAYSTISHCGFLMVMYTTGVIEFVLLYLYVHGFFKAAVFMCVGNVNRFSHNNQDFKRMGQYYKFLPFDCLVSFIGLINLSGLPFTFGFYIKHLLFVGLNMNYFIYYFVLVNCLLGAFTGLFYSYRLFFNVFFDFKKSRKSLYLHASHSILNSKFYSNINFSATFAILGLMFVSYVVSLFLIYIYLNVEQNFSNFSNFLIFSSFIDGINSSFNFLNNVSILNWIVIFLGSAIIFTPWRTSVIRSKYIDSFFIFTMFSSLFYVLYFIIF